MGHIPHGRVGSERTSPVTFWFPDHPFANFYPCPVTIDGHTYPTVEHYYQAAKFANHSEIRRKVAGSADPTSAKALSRQYQSLVRRDWDTVKELVMYEAQVAKFAQHPDLRTKLIDSQGRDLVEDSPDDDYWGRTSVGKGFNRMGVLLINLKFYQRILLRLLSAYTDTIQPPHLSTILHSPDLHIVCTPGHCEHSLNSILSATPTRFNPLFSCQCKRSICSRQWRRSSLYTRILGKPHVPRLGNVDQIEDTPGRPVLHLCPIVRIEALAVEIADP